MPSATAPAFWYPYLWSWGGKEVEADGKTVALNSKETIELVKFAVAFWKECFDEGAMSWDDAGNNRAFLANTISSTSNGASIYLLAKAKADTYMTETDKPLKDDIFHSPLPKGPAGQFSYHVPFSNLVPTYSKNQKAAKDFLRWFHTKEIYGEWFTSQQGFSTGTTKMWEDDPVWKVDPVMAPFRTSGGKRPLRRLRRTRRPRRRRGRSANSSSSTCTRKRSRARRRRTPSNGRTRRW